jgi:hypothetical protein
VRKRDAAGTFLQYVWVVFFNLPVLAGILAGGFLVYCLIEQFYFHQVVVITLFGLPILMPVVLRAPRRSLLAMLVLSIPFNPCFHIFHTTRTAFNADLNFWSSDLVLLAMFAFLLLRSTFSTEPQSPRAGLSWLILPLLVWIAAGALSLIPAVDKTLALVQLARMTRVLAITVVVFYLVDGPEDFRLIIYSLLAAFTVQAGLIFIEFGSGHPLFRLPGEMRSTDMAGELIRPGGTMGHSSNFAKLAALCLPIALSLFLVGRNRWLRLAAGGCLLAGLLALVMTLSRSGIATSVFALGTLLYLIIGRRRTTGGAVIVAAGLLIAGLAWGWFVAGDRVMTYIHDDEGSANMRPKMWAVAANIIEARPMTGVGLNNYTFVAARYHSDADELHRVPVHNIYLLEASEMGIVGATAFLWFLTALILAAFASARQARPTSDSILLYAIGIGIACSWAQGLVGWGFRSSIVHTSYLAILAALLAAWRFRWRASISQKGSAS